MMGADESHASRKRPQSPTFSERPSKRDSATPHNDCTEVAAEGQSRILQFFVEAPDMVMQCRRTFVIQKPADNSVQSVVDHLLDSADSDTGIPKRFYEYVRLSRRNGQPLSGAKRLEEAGIADGMTLYLDGTIPKNVLSIQREMETLHKIVAELQGEPVTTENSETPGTSPLGRFKTVSDRFLHREPDAEGFFFSPGVAKIFLAEGGLRVLTSVSAFEEPEQVDGPKTGRYAVFQFVTDLAAECTRTPSADRLGHHGAAIVLAMLKEWSSAGMQPSQRNAHQLLGHVASPLGKALTFFFEESKRESFLPWFNLSAYDLLTQLWDVLKPQLKVAESGTLAKVPNLVVPYVCVGIRAILARAESLEATRGPDWGCAYGTEVYRVAKQTAEELIRRRALDGPEKLDAATSVVKKTLAALLSLMRTLALLEGVHSARSPTDSVSDDDSVSSDGFARFLDSHKTMVNALVSTVSNTLTGFKDLRWLLSPPYREVLTLDSKRAWLEYNLPNIHADSQVEIEVDRGNLLADAFDKLAYEDAAELRAGGVYPTFAEEEGYGPGVRREFFVSVARELFDPAHALFLCSPLDRRRVFPNQASDCNPGHLAYFKFCGRFLALALAHRVQLGVALAPALFRLLVMSGDALGDVSKELTRLDEAADVDCDTWRSCKQLLDMDAEMIDSLGLSFVCCIEKLGTQTEVPLLPGGEDIPVGAHSLRHFLGLKLRTQLYEPVRCQVAALQEGFREMLVQTGASLSDVLEPVGAEDFGLILQGDPADISLDEWKAHTSYHGYTDSDASITWFWEAVESFAQERRRRLLFFATSFNYLPPTGFKGLPDRFHIHRGSDGLEMLPISHTCFLQLVLPPYDSYEMMRQRLMIVSDAHVAESFGMT